MRRRIIQSEHHEAREIADDFDFSYAYGPIKNQCRLTAMFIVSLLFCTLIFFCLTIHFWAKQFWYLISHNPFEEYEVLFIFYDLLIVHCLIIWYVFCRARRVQFVGDSVIILSSY